MTYDQIESAANHAKGAIDKIVSGFGAMHERAILAEDELAELQMRCKKLAASMTIRGDAPTHSHPLAEHMVRYARELADMAEGEQR